MEGSLKITGNFPFVSSECAREIRRGETAGPGVSSRMDEGREGRGGKG